MRGAAVEAHVASSGRTGAPRRRRRSAPPGRRRSRARASSRRVVERAGAEQADLLLRREEQLDAGVRPPLRDDPPRGLDHRRDRRLVVRAEDRAAGVADDAVLDDGLDRPLRRNGVEVRAEEDGRPAFDRRPAGGRGGCRRSSRSATPASSSSTSSPSRAARASRGRRRRAPPRSGSGSRRARGSSERASSG